MKAFRLWLFAFCLSFSPKQRKCLPNAFVYFLPLNSFSFEFPLCKLLNENLRCSLNHLTDCICLFMTFFWHKSIFLCKPFALWCLGQWEKVVSKHCVLNSSDSLLTWETATLWPPLIHNQPSNTPLPQWFNCLICHGCCSHHNKRHDNDHFQSPTRHAVFHSWSNVSVKPFFFPDEYFILS